MIENEEELKSLLMKVKEESEKVRLKLSIQKTKIMASGPITSWEIDGETVETVTDFILGGSRITADGNCSHEIKRHLLLGRKAMTILDSISKSKNITFLTKVHLVKFMVFPVVMCGCESWTIKKAEHWRTDDFELWCWRRLLRVPWTARRSNQSILKEISLNIHCKDWCWNSNTWATWCEELTHLKRPWCWERLKAGEGRDRGWDDWMASPTRWTWVWASSGGWWWTGRSDILQSMGSQRVIHDWATKLNWTKVASVLSLCDPMDCSPPGSSVHGILQVRVMEWVATPSSRVSSQPRDRTHVSYVSNPHLLCLLYWQAGSLPLTPPTWAEGDQIYISY